MRSMPSLLKTSLTLLITATTLGSTTMLVSCASKPKHSFSAEAIPENEEKNVTAELETLRAQQIDVFSPKHFRQAEKSLAQARNGLRDRDDRTEILNTLQVAKNSMHNARTHGEQWKADMKPAADARQKVIATGVPAQEFPELSNVDKDLMDITEENFASNKHGDDASDLQKRYFDLELKAVQTQQLSNARNMIETARDEGAKKYAKKTLEKAEQDLLTAERQIEASRGQPDAYKASVDAANNSARELLAITLASKDAKGKTPEEIAVAARAKEKELAAQIAAKDVLAVEARTRVNVLSERNRTQGGMIATQNQELDAARSSNDKLSRERAHIEKIKEIEGKFSKDEAEVYRQGENVVVRLKSMQFASARSDLPAASIATLAKVKSALEELRAEKVVVEGHTDSVGSKSANQKISEQRAEAVSKYLAAQGQSASTVQTVGYGFEKPLATNKTKEGRATNRRVDVIITPSTQAE